MTKLRLLLRNIRYFRWSNLAVLAGMAVATAVLTGALMVGDSVRGSLRALAVQRLGPVEHALVATRFFEQSLVERVRRALAGANPPLSPAILVRGGASSADGSARVANVQIAAVGGPGFGQPWVAVAPQQAFINGEIASGLGAREGADLLY